MKVNKTLEEKEIFLVKYSYPQEAKGWVNGIYEERIEHIVLSTDKLQQEARGNIFSRMWTETEETGFGVYEYVEGIGLGYYLPNGNYQVEVKIQNNMETTEEKKFSVKANGIVKIKNQTKIKEGTYKFIVPVSEEKLILQVYEYRNATRKEDSREDTIVIEEIQIIPYESIEEKKEERIYLLSDSTVQSYDESQAPQTGWGQKLIDYFQVEEGSERKLDKNNFLTSRLHIYNKAMGGRSVKSFYNEGRLDEILTRLLPGDYCFIQFGHNDDTKARPNRYVTVDNYYKYLDFYVEGILQRKGIPVLISPVARRNCDDLGVFRISFNNYRQAMMKLAREKDIIFLDLGKESTQLLQEYGVERSKELFMWVREGEYPNSNFRNGATDNTHLQEKGAKCFAGIVAKLIKEYKEDNRLESLQAKLK